MWRMPRVPDTAAAAPPRRGGRPRSSAAERAILDATREMLVEGGVRHLTIEGVAARAGVAKTTVYRRWRSKDELALAVLIDMSEHIAAVPDLGDTREELVAFVGNAIRLFTTTLMGRVMQGIVSDLAADEELAEAFRSRAVAMRQAETRRLVERAVARGDMRPGTDPVLAHEVLFGPVYYRLFLSGRPLDAALAERVVDAALAAFAPDAAGPAALSS
jgi:AcrR family transcriptional regulator